MLKQKKLSVLNITGFFFRFNTRMKAEVPEFFCFNSNVCCL